MNSAIVELKFPLTILNWNVRGIGDLDKCAVVKDMVCDVKPDLVCLQETKWNSCTKFRIKQVCPSRFTNFIALDALGTRGGIILAWSNIFSSTCTFKNSFSVTAALCIRGFNFMITVVYGPQQDSEKLSFLNELRSIREGNDLPWILVGDFNLYREVSDTTGEIRNLETGSSPK